MAEYQILWWYDKIPVQVRAKDKDNNINQQMPDRFMEAVDLAAMKTQMLGSDVYTEGFQWTEWQKRLGSASEVAEQLIAELDGEHPQIDWRAIAQELPSATG